MPGGVFHGVAEDKHHIAEMPGKHRGPHSRKPLTQISISDTLGSWLSPCGNRPRLQETSEILPWNWVAYHYNSFDVKDTSLGKVRS